MRALIFNLLLVGLLVSSGAFSVLAQGSISFEARTDARQVVIRNYFQISFILKNANGQSFQPPAFRNFKVVGGPNRSMSTTIINGQMSKETSFSYNLIGEKVGNFSIESARISANGKQYKTNPISIKVVKGAATSGNTGGSLDHIFITTELSDSNAFVGQQVLLDYKIYTTKEIDSYNLISESEYQGLFSQEITRFNSRAFKEVINGVQYTTKILKRVALFPQQIGTIDVEPIRLKLGVVKPNQGRRRGFFMYKDVDYIQLSSNAISLKVIALPQAPDDFSGAVGEYIFQTEVPKTNITTDDALSIKISVKGNGDNKRLVPPKLELPGSFEVYEPKLIFEEIGENGGEIQHVKTYEFLSIPTIPGHYAVTPQFTYFNIDSSGFISLRPNTYSIAVRKGKGIKPSISDSQITPNEIKLSPIKEELKLYKVGDYFFGSWLFWTILLTPFLVLGFAYWQREKRLKEAGIDPKIRKYKKAYALANKRMEAAKEHQTQGDSKAFFDEISKSTFGYVCDKFNIPLSALNKANIHKKLNQNKVSEGLSKRFMDIISRCEMALFAGMDNAGSMQETYDQAVQIIVDLEKEMTDQ